MNLQSGNAVLEQRRLEYWKHFGEVSDQVVSRLNPTRGALWPSSALGRMRIVQRSKSRMLVTDGLSCPFDPALHGRQEPFPLDFELCFDIFHRDPASKSDEELAGSWYPSLMYGLTDWLIPQRVNLRGLLGKFTAITLTTPANTPEARELSDATGMVGLLIGLPLIGSDPALHPYLNGYYEGLPVPYSAAAIGVFPVKPLMPDELAWAKARGNEGALQLARKFISRGDSYRHWRGRPSVLEVPEFVAPSSKANG